MALTKQTTIIFSYRYPTYTPTPPLVDPYLIDEASGTAFGAQCQIWVDEGKTDNLRYSTTIGTIIRRWSDEVSAQDYVDYLIANLIHPFGVTDDQYTVSITDIPTE